MSEFEVSSLDQILVPNLQQKISRTLGELIMRGRVGEGDSFGVERVLNFSEFYLTLDDEKTYQAIFQSLPRGRRVSLFRYLIAPIGMTRIISNPYYSSTYRRRHLVIEPARPSESHPAKCHGVLETWDGKTFDYKLSTDLRREFPFNSNHDTLDYLPEAKTTVVTMWPVSSGSKNPDSEADGDIDLVEEYTEVMNVVYKRMLRSDNG